MGIEKTADKPNVLHLLKLEKEVPIGICTLVVSPEYRAYADKHWQMVKPMMVPIPAGCTLDKLGYRIQVDHALETCMAYFVWKDDEGVEQKRGIQYQESPK